MAKINDDTPDFKDPVANPDFPYVGAAALAQVLQTQEKNLHKAPLEILAGTTSQRAELGTPEIGALFYNTTDSKLQVYHGGWLDVGPGAGGGGGSVSQALFILGSDLAAGVGSGSLQVYIDAIEVADFSIVEFGAGGATARTGAGAVNVDPGGGLPAGAGEFLYALRLLVAAGDIGFDELHAENYLNAPGENGSGSGPGKYAVLFTSRSGVISLTTDISGGASVVNPV